MSKSSIRNVVLILVLATTGSQLQARPTRDKVLAFTGTLASVTPQINTTTKPVFLYRLRLHLQIRNDSSTTLLILKPEADEIERRIEFLDRVSVDPDNDFGVIKVSTWQAPYITKSTRFRLAEYDWVGAYIRSLDFREPSNYVLKIPPEGYYEFIEEITIEDGFTSEVRGGQSLSEAAKNTPVAEHPAIRIKYHFASGKRHRDEKLLRTLRERWKPFGHFVLDSNGDFSITSDAILMPTGY